MAEFVNGTRVDASSRSGGRTNGNNPVSYYFGKGQTKRVGQNYTPGGTGNQRAAEFKATADETLDGGKADLLTITNASDESTIDIPNGPDDCALQFPKGRYHILFQGYTEAQYQTTFRVELKQLQTETDDTLIIHTPGYSGGSSPARTAYQLIWFDLIIKTGTEKFYFLFPRAGGSNRSHFLRIEKVA